MTRRRPGAAGILGALIFRAPQAGGGQGLIDAVLASGSKSGYTFVITPAAAVPGVSAATFSATANPTVTSGVSQTGTRKFGTTQDGVMHGQTDALGTALTAAELAATNNVLGN